jgi:hypothetical protein
VKLELTAKDAVSEKAIRDSSMVCICIARNSEQSKNYMHCNGRPKNYSGHWPVGFPLIFGVFSCHVLSKGEDLEWLIVVGSFMMFHYCHSYETRICSLILVIRSKDKEWDDPR